MPLQDDIVARLSAHRALAGVPRPQLEWVAAHGRMWRIESGDRLSDDMTQQGVFIVLSGRFNILVDRGLGPRSVLEWRGGDVAGFLPYSRMTATPGRVHVDEPGDAVLIDRRDFREMICECHELTAVFVGVMVDRARRFTQYDVHAEKMMSLGRLAAGLAHELNNPASALARSSRELTVRLRAADAAAYALAAVGLTGDQLGIVSHAARRCRAAVAAQSPMAQADREDAIGGWLEAHALDPDHAEALAGSGVAIDDLDALARSVGDRALQVVVESLAASCAMCQIATEIETAAARIHTLVAAVKGFTAMDRSAAPMPVDVGQGLADTLAMLRAKVRGKSIAVTVDVEPGLPRARGIGGELNQVWMNLIDNALDAAPVDGHVRVSAASERGAVVVRIVDDGPGIPADIRDRIFDPFFTTKPLGQGTGLGLDIARRLVDQNNGEIDVSSTPGSTEFRVTIPLA